ncbi:hypothetical protein LY78DRAFT_654143, partial [Colletotrichum sublineola]
MHHAPFLSLFSFFLPFDHSTATFHTTPATFLLPRLALAPFSPSIFRLRSTLVPFPILPSLLALSRRVPIFLSQG